MVDPTGTIVPPYTIFYNMPISEEIVAPSFEPYPLCGYSINDVEYMIMDINGNVDPYDWIHHDFSSSTLVIELDDESFIDAIVTLRL